MKMKKTKSSKPTKKEELSSLDVMLLKQKLQQYQTEIQEITDEIIEVKKELFEKYIGKYYRLNTYATDENTEAYLKITSTTPHVWDSNNADIVFVCQKITRTFIDIGSDPLIYNHREEVVVVIEWGLISLPDLEERYEEITYVDFKHVFGKIEKNIFKFLSDL